MTVASILLHEWERWSGVLPDSTLIALAAGQPRVVDVRPRIGGGCELVARHWVGVGRFRDLDLRIVPKVPVASVLALIEDDLERLNVVDQGLLGVSTELQELIGHAFVAAVTRICRRGLRRDYVQREETLAFARGRIDVRLTSLEHASARARIACAFEEFEQDGPANRALAFALQRMIGRPEVFSAPLRRTAAEVARALPPPLAVTPSAIGRLALESRDPFYRSALRFAELVLRALGFSDDLAGSEASGFWIDMNALFQAFVARSVRKQLRPHDCVVSAEPERFLDEARSVKLRPDVLVRQGRAELPIDAKYKDVREPLNEDIYQVLAYCRALGSPAGVIVVPGAGTPRRIHCRGGEEIWTAAFDLSSRESMAISAGELARQALGLIQVTQ